MHAMANVYTKVENLDIICEIETSLRNNSNLMGLDTDITIRLNNNYLIGLCICVTSRL